VILVACIVSHSGLGIAIPLSIIPILFVRRLDWLLIGLGDERSVAIAAIARELVYLALVFTVVLQFKSVTAAVWSMLAAEVAPLIITAMAARRHALKASQDGPRNSQPLARAGLPLVVMGIMYLTYTKIDTLMIARLINAQAAGIYYASYSVLFGALSIAAPLSRAALPEMSRLGGRGATVTPGMFRLSLIAAGAGALIGVGLVVLARPVLGLLYGDRFLVGATKGIPGEVDGSCDENSTHAHGSTPWADRPAPHAPREPRRTPPATAAYPARNTRDPAPAPTHGESRPTPRPTPHETPNDRRTATSRKACAPIPRLWRKLTSVSVRISASVRAVAIAAPKMPIRGMSHRFTATLVPAAIPDHLARLT